MFETQSNYKALRSIVSERSRDILFWVGSGLSISSGLPSWKALRKSLQDAFDEKVQTFEEEDRDKAAGKSVIIQREDNAWTAFDMLKSELGRTSYQATIRKSLSIADKCEIPTIYKQIWSLRPRGVLNLNLDRLAAKAFAVVRPGATLHEFQGKQAGSFVHLLKSPVPFLANLHGISADESSWAFTRTDLGNLLSDNAYRTFLTACLINSTIVFVGISADDVAVRGHIDTLNSWGINSGEHFWITSRRDRQTDRWAEDSGILVIRYDSQSESNHSQLNVLFNDLQKFVSHDVTPSPVTPVHFGKNTLDPMPDSAVLMALDHEKTRVILNTYAAAILSSDDVSKYEVYDKFCRQYKAAIHKAWFIDEDPPENILLGYEIQENLAKGAFGKVFRAKAPNGDFVAIKLLHMDARTDQRMLQSFRRGVASMRILSENKVPGMVGYHQASEIPACVIMDLIVGLNLNEAVKSKYLERWSVLLRIAYELVNTIRLAHSLPQRVLHRDIRPSNIMLKDCFYDIGSCEVVVLDFDLSWHRDAHELSVLATSASGYLAPEQVIQRANESTRNSLVDSYGLGMTFYYMRTGNEPSFNQHKHLDWKEKLKQEVGRHTNESWKSLPTRFSRLIEFATQDVQSNRWDISQIKGELERLRQADQNPTKVRSAELLVEELLFRSELKNFYIWNPDSISAISNLPNGLVITCKGFEVDQTVELEIVWTRSGTEDNRSRNLIKFLKEADAKISSYLTQAGWNKPRTLKSPHMYSMNTNIHTRALCENLEKVVRSLDNSVGALNF